MRSYGLVMFTAAVLSLTGCLSPGKETREALSQTKTYEWAEGGRFRVDAVGPQTERFLMLEGEIVMNEDGTPNWAESKIAYYLSAEPSADAAAGAFGQALIAAVRQSEMMAKSFGELTTLVSTLIPTRVAASAEAPDGGR